MSKSYRIVIIGVGAIANIHARAIVDLPNAELVAGSCRTEKKGREYALQWNCQWFADYEHMLDSVKPDLAIICTPSGAHLEPTLACAQRGIHVLCEKPLEITVDRIDQMIQATSEAGVLLGGIFQQRYNKLINLLRQAIAAGRFGRLATISITVPWWRDDAYYAPDRWQGSAALDGGGAMMNQSIHYIDLLQWLAAASMPELRPEENPVADVFCFTGKLGHSPDLIEVEDTAVGVVRLHNGAVGQMLTATSMYPGKQRRILVGGRDGTVEIEEDHLLAWDFRESTDEDQRVLETFGQKSDYSAGASDPMAINHDIHASNIADFLSAIETGQTPAIHGIEARKSVAIIQACYESARTGQLRQPSALPSHVLRK